MPENIKEGMIYLTAGIILSGIFVFLFNVIVARSLGPEKYGVIGVLYSMITIVSLLLSYGVKEGMTKFISEFEAKKEVDKIYGSIKNGLKLELILASLFLISVFLSLDIILEEFLDQNIYLFSFFVLGVLFFVFTYLFRGILQGFRELKDSSISLVTEHFSRIGALLLLLLFWGQMNVEIVGLSLMLAPFSSLVITLILLLKAKERFSTKGRNNFNKVVNFAIPTTFIGFFSMCFLFSGPILIKFFGGSNSYEAAGFFAAGIYLLRPAQALFNAFFVSIFPYLSRAEALEDKKNLNRYIKNSFILILGISAIIIIFSLLLGEWVIDLVYGKDFLLSGLDLSLMGMIIALYLISQLLNRILLAKGLAIKTLLCWIVGITLLILFLEFSKTAILMRVELGLCIAGVVTNGLMFLVFNENY